VPESPATPEFPPVCAPGRMPTDWPLNVSLNIQTARLGLGREFIGDFDRDLHRKTVAQSKVGHFSAGYPIDFARNRYLDRHAPRQVVGRLYRKQRLLRAHEFTGL
jgi:hypothetical protein